MDADTRLHVAVLIEEQRQPNAWEAWRFRIADVVPDEGQFGTAARVLRDDGRCLLRLHPGLEVALHRDEGEGYHLNLTSGAPVWFVMWRVDDADPSRAWPEFVTLSYNEAGRLLDAQERVDNVPLPASVVPWLQAYTDEHYRPEPKKRSRPPSFRAPSERA
jgi:phosphoglycolate phosphatase-like HAD superfamily hydrolase